MYKVCIWTPIITHHQSAFHDAILKSKMIDLEVRYFNEITEDRLALGWENRKDFKPFEQRVATLTEGIQSLKDMNERIHIISGNGYSFTRVLIDYCCSHNLKWINWVERSGVRLFYLLNQNSFLFRLFFPFYQRFYNRKFAQKIQKYAMGTFVSGVKAEEDYLKKGVSKEKIKQLFYALEPLHDTSVIPESLQKSKFKYHFIYVGALTKRKGIDVLLKAYSRIENNEWGLILVGADRSNGEYQRLAQQLNILDKVLFTGAVDFTKINEYMSFGDVFILPTRFDGWGAVLNEAAALGMPMISTDQCGAAFHLIEDDINGYIVKAGSVKNLYVVMKSYVDDKTLILKHEIATKRLEEKLTVSSNVTRLINNLKELEIIRRKDVNSSSI